MHQNCSQKLHHLAYLVKTKTKILLMFFVSDIMVQRYGTCDHDLSKENKILIELLLIFSIIVINIIKPLATIQIKAGSTMIKESHSAR